MSEVQLELEVRSNVDALSARRLHDGFVRMVEEVTSTATEFLRADRMAHSRSGLSAEHVKHERVVEVAEMIEAKFGVTEVTEKDERPTHGIFKHSQAPIFVDEGTRSPIFPAKSSAMWNREEGIIGRLWVRGQHAQRFMAKTYAETLMLIREDKEISLALTEMAAKAAAMRAEMDL